MALRDAIARVKLRVERARADHGAVAAALLVASYLLAQITLVAAELNAVLAERRKTRQSSLGRALYPPRPKQHVQETGSMI